MIQRESDIAWAAGLFEGEGSFTSETNIDKRNSLRYIKFNLALQTTDIDVGEKFERIVGGRSGKLGKTTTGKLLYRWSMGNRLEIIKTVKLFLPHLGKRRRERAIKLIDDIRIVEAIKESKPPYKHSEETKRKISESLKGLRNYGTNSS